MAVIDIKIVSDVICPFCYLGKKRLEKAMEMYKKTVPGGADDRFAVSWAPFYLDPTAPRQSIPINERMAQKFGADRVSALNARMRAMGAAEGINFTHQGKVGSTRDAHRLVQLAKTKDAKDGKEVPTSSSGSSLQNTLMANIFRSYFEEGGDITSHDMLVAAAEKAGIDGAEARAWLAGDNGGPAVDAEVETAYARNIHGVPHFIINDTVEVGGAQNVETFISEFVRAKKQ